MNKVVLLVFVLALAYVCADTNLDFDEGFKGHAKNSAGKDQHKSAPAAGKSKHKAAAAHPKAHAGKQPKAHAGKKLKNSAKRVLKAAGGKARKIANAMRAKSKRHARHKQGKKHHKQGKNHEHEHKRHKRRNAGHNRHRGHKRHNGKNKRHKKEKVCPEGLQGKACRRGKRCVRRHKACHDHCLSMKRHTKQQCADICFHRAKLRACNRCHNDECRKERHACLVDLKMCQGKCHSTDVTCMRACRCTLHKKAAVKPAAAVVKPAATLVKPAAVIVGKPAPAVAKPAAAFAKPAAVAKPAAGVKTVTPAKPLAPKKVEHQCPCSHRVRHCTPVKECTLRDTTPVKTCVQEENTEVVLCECAKKDAHSECIEKKMHTVCIQKDTLGKCVKQEARCLPSCAKVDPKTKVCTEYNKHQQMKCVKYDMIASHKCMKEGFSHKCAWRCVQRGCPGKHQLTRIEHPVIPTAPVKKYTTVKILDSKGHEYTEEELKALKQHDIKTFNDIIKALKTAEGEVASPAQAYEIKEAENKIEAEAKGF